MSEKKSTKKKGTRRTTLTFTEDMSPAERSLLMAQGPVGVRGMELAGIAGAPGALVGLQRGTVPTRVDHNDPQLRQFQALDYISKLFGLVPGGTSGVLRYLRLLGVK